MDPKGPPKRADGTKEEAFHGPLRSTPAPGRVLRSAVGVEAIAERLGGAMPDIVLPSRFRDAVQLRRYTVALVRVANAERARWHEDAWIVRDVLGGEDRPWGRASTNAIGGHPQLRWRGRGPDVDQHCDLEENVQTACWTWSRP